MPWQRPQLHWATWIEAMALLLLLLLLADQGGDAAMADRGRRSVLSLAAVIQDAWLGSTMATRLLRLRC
jgi:hypothetical protein